MPAKKDQKLTQEEQTAILIRHLYHRLPADRKLLVINDMMGWLSKQKKKLLQYKKSKR